MKAVWIAVIVLNTASTVSRVVTGDWIEAFSPLAIVALCVVILLRDAEIEQLKESRTRTFLAFKDGSR